MLSSTLIQTWGRIIGALLTLAGVISLVISPFIGKAISATLWGVEPLAYIGAVLLIGGLAVISLSYFVSEVTARKGRRVSTEEATLRRWSQTTQQYFELFDHDLGRPLRRILGKERELNAILQSSGDTIAPAFKELLYEIERQAPNFRLMLSNIQVLVQLEAPDTPARVEPIEPAEVVRKIVDRYIPVSAQSQKEITWWAEPTEFGIVYSDSSAVEHIVTNLVDNAVRFASSHIEMKLTKNPDHFFVRVWDDGPGIAPQYLRHIFDRGWTPELARREEKSSSGLGLFIARTLAKRSGGDLTVESLTAPDGNHHTAFFLALPLGAISNTVVMERNVH
jgi:signal transduction histidine kinase